MTTSPAPRPSSPPARTLPHSARSELAVLGSMLASPAVIARAEELLRPEDFYALRHRLIFRAAVDLRAREVDVELITLENLLIERKQLDEVGGMDYLHKLFEETPTATSLEHYAKVVKDKATRRRVIEAADEMLKHAYDSEVETPDLVEGAERALATLSHEVITRPYHHIRDVVTEAYASIEAVHDRKKPTIGVPTGLCDLDAMLSGLVATDLVILAARPSVGKTALSLHIARSVSEAAPGSVLVFSFEMGRIQLALRLIAAESGIELTQIRTGRFADATWPHITAACGSLSNQRIVLDDTRNTTLREMRAKARRVQSELGLSLVVVDYLQLMENRSQRKSDTREQEIASLSRGLKQMAGEFNVPVLALSQLSRKVEERSDKRPQLSDLRESGAIEQDADVVLFIHREERYKQEEENKGVAEVIVAKQRNGPLGTARVRFRPETGRFFDLEEGR